MEDLTLSKFDAGLQFQQALIKNIEVNGLESAMTQFKAIANSFSQDLFVDFLVINTLNEERI